jgi:CheY-like chemotaxis protein
VQLLEHLNQNPDDLPDIIFLDLNMPRKNGFEALKELKLNTLFKTIPVAIYSTSYEETVAGLLYDKGANFYIRKTDVESLRSILQQFFSKYAMSSFARPQKDQFAFAV